MTLQEAVRETSRDRNYQAILPLRGKVLNTESATLKKVLENKEIQDMVTASDANWKPFDISRLRYERVILLADADSDGHHITTLLLTFFYRHMPGLISGSNLYRVTATLSHRIGKETFWAADDAESGTNLGQGYGRSPNPISNDLRGWEDDAQNALGNNIKSYPHTRLLRVEIDDQLRPIEL